jgi:Resolvase, N terminal domain
MIVASDHQDIPRIARAKGASLRATEQPIDTGTAAGKCSLDVLGVFAEFETNLRRERQLEGIAKAKAVGVPIIRSAMVKRQTSLWSGWPRVLGVPAVGGHPGAGGIPLRRASSRRTV